MEKITRDELWILETACESETSNSYAKTCLRLITEIKRLHEIIIAMNDGVKTSLGGGTLHDNPYSTETEQDCYKIWESNWRQSRKEQLLEILAERVLDMKNANNAYMTAGMLEWEEVKAALQKLLDFGF